MSFLAEYFGVIESTADQAVCCPFDHQTPQGLVYKESRASAHINTEKKYFIVKLVVGAILNNNLFKKY